MHFYDRHYHFTIDEARDVASMIAKGIANKAGKQLISVAHHFYKGGVHEDRMELLDELAIVGVEIPEWFRKRQSKIGGNKAGHKRWRFPPQIVEAERAAGRTHPQNVCREYVWKKLLMEAFQQEGVTLWGFDPSTLSAEYARLEPISRTFQNADRGQRRKDRPREADRSALFYATKLVAAKNRTASVVQFATREKDRVIKKQAERIDKLVKMIEAMRGSDHAV